MKKILLLAFAATALFFTACSSDDDNPTRDEQLKQRLIEVGTWKNYGTYKVTREMVNGKYKYDTTFSRNIYGNGTYLHKFTNADLTIVSSPTEIQYYNYYIKNDTMYSKLTTSSAYDMKSHIYFSGDSCVLTDSWSNNYHLFTILYRK